MTIYLTEDEATILKLYRKLSPLEQNRLYTRLYNVVVRKAKRKAPTAAGNQQGDILPFILGESRGIPGKRRKGASYG